jgi:hypothetical protein
MINHAWHTVRRALGHDLSRSSCWGNGLSQLITFIAIVVAWVFFRAESFDAAINILSGMIGINGFALPENYLAYLNYINGLGDYLTTQGWLFMTMSLFKGIEEVAHLFLLLILVWYFPNTQQFMKSQWKPSLIWAISFTTLSIYSILNLTRMSEFLYFQF